MDEKFWIGLAVGMLGGGLIVANSVKVRQMIKDGQEQVKSKAKQMAKSVKTTKKQSEKNESDAKSGK